MNRAIVWWPTLVISVGLIAATWIFRNFDRIPNLVHTPPEQEAQRNGYLALERFAKAMGRPMTVSSDPRAIDALVKPGVFILDEGGGRNLGALRLRSLLSWVDAGGHLIVPVGSLDRDPLIEALGVRLAARAPASGPSRTRLVQPEKIRLHPEGSPPGFVLSVDESGPVLIAGAVPPEWSAGSPGRTAILHFVRKQGAVTLVSPWSVLANNAAFAKGDNAGVVWLLLNLVDRAGPVVLVTRIHVATIWEWLRESAWFVLVSTALVLMAWIARIAPRFGPLIPEPAPDRRALVEHLQAMGRALWRTREDEALRYWLYCVRRAVLSRAAARNPMLLGYSDLEQARTIAARVSQKAELDEKRVRIALAGVATTPDGSEARQGFTEIVAVLQKVDAQL
jgi:hypothetical protein